MSATNISGVLVMPDGTALSAAELEFISLETTGAILKKNGVNLVTDNYGNYSVDLLQGKYRVRLREKNKNTYAVLGEILIEENSPDGTLNDYLRFADAEISNPTVYADIQQMYRQTRAAAEKTESVEKTVEQVAQQVNAVQQLTDAAAQSSQLTQQHAEQAVLAQQQALAAEQAAQQAREDALKAAAGAAAAAQAETEKLTEKLVTDGSEIAGHGATTIANVLNAHGATTSSQGIGFGPDDEPDLTTDHSVALQQMLSTYKYVVFDTVVNCAETVKTGGAGQVITATGIGELRPVSTAMSKKTLLALAHERCIVAKMLITNPLLLKTQTGGRQCAIEIRADNCQVHDSVIINPQNGIQATSVYAPAHTKITNNRIIDVLGAGDGEGDLTSNYGEDRGDAVTIWGSAAVIIGNHATCKPGQDARIAFHAEYPVSKPTNVREIDGCHTLMIGNYARGSFRRHFVMEGITNGLMSNNISAGGATWWAVAIIQCTNVKTENQILWDNPGSTAGQKWNPVRAAIGAINFNKNVTFNDSVKFTDGAQGYGFAIATQTGEHIIDLSVTLSCAGNKYATYLLRPKLLRMRGVKIDGAENGHRFICATGQTGFIPTVYDTDGHITTTEKCVTMDTGSGGKWIARNCEYLSGGDTAFLLFNMDNVTLQNCTFSATKYAVSLAKTKSIKMTGCISDSSESLPVRINYNTTGNIGLSDWFFDSNALTVDFRYTDESLSNINSPLNVKHKWPGRVISTGAAQYVAAGGAPGSGWVPLTGGEKIMPAQPEVTEQ